MAWLAWQRSAQQAERATMLTSLSCEELREYLLTHGPRQTGLAWLLLLPSALGGILIGMIVYYLMSERVEARDATLRLSRKLIQSFFTPEEWLIIRTLAERRGEATQYELSRLEGMNKLRVHRLLNTLEQKGLVKRYKTGRQNRVLLDDTLSQILKNTPSS